MSDQDEAERLAFEKIYEHNQGAVFFKDSSEGKEWKRNIAEYFHRAGYRAGQASGEQKESESWSKRYDDSIQHLQERCSAYLAELTATQTIAQNLADALEGVLAVADRKTKEFDTARAALVAYYTESNK